MKHINNSIILFVILLWSIYPVFGQNVELNRARNYVQHWLATDKTTSRTVASVDSIVKNDVNYLYLFQLQPKGFVITNTKNQFDVVAYSLENNTNLSDLQKPGVAMFIDGYIQYLTDNDFKWENSTETNRTETLVVSPLISTNWDQDYPYNMYCPTDASGPGGHAYAGCIATAGGQVLRYWTNPVHGRGTNTYTHATYGTITADFGNATYNWTSIQANNSSEIAKLLFHLGVASYMNYGPSGSGTQTEKLQDAFVKNFYTSPGIRYARDDYSLTDWKNMINGNLNQAIPVLYDGQSSAGGHIWVCDGVNSSGLYHMNWGWGGSSNGYFNLSNLNGFNTGQNIVLNVKPLNATAPMTYVPDDNFENALIQKNYDYTLDNYVYTDVLNCIQNLVVGNKGISDLTGIEACTNLEKFICAQNNITTLNMSNSPKLFYLYADTNQIQNLNLTGCSGLELLSIKTNNLQNLDLSDFPLLYNINCSSNPNLQSIDLRNGNNSIITSLNASNNPNLSCIYVSDLSYCTTNLSNYIGTNTHFVLDEAACSALATSDYFDESSLQIFPNPTADILHLMSAKEISSLEVYNTLGEKVNFYKSNLSTIDVSQLVSGMYVLKINFADQTMLVKTILKN